MANVVAAAEALCGHPDVTSAETVRMSIDGEEVLLGLAEVRSFVSGSLLREYVWQKVGDQDALAGVLIFERIPRVDGAVDSAAVAQATAEEGSTLLFQQPVDQLESDVAAAWAACLGVPRVSTHDDFFDLGGESTTAVQIAVELERRTGAAIDVDELLDAGSVHNLAKLLRER